MATYCNKPLIIKLRFNFIQQKNRYEKKIFFSSLPFLKIVTLIIKFPFNLNLKILKKFDIKTNY